MEERLWSVYVSEIGRDRVGETALDDSAVKEFSLRLDSTAARDSGMRSGSATFVSMMETAQLWDRHDPPGFWSLDGA